MGRKDHGSKRPKKGRPARSVKYIQGRISSAKAAESKEAPRSGKIRDCRLSPVYQIAEVRRKIRRVVKTKSQRVQMVLECWLRMAQSGPFHPTVETIAAELGGQFSARDVRGIIEKYGPACGIKMTDFERKIRWPIKAPSDSEPLE
jgi:hypothetical protein